MCVFCQIFQSTLIAINLSSNHFRIFERCFIFQSFVNFQIVCCSANVSTFNANNASSDHLYVQMRLCLPNLSKLIMRQDKGPFCQKNLKTKKNLFYPILKIGQGKGPFHQNNLKTQSFPQRQKIQNFLVVRISRTKTFQTECVNCFRNKNALRVRKSLLQTCHFYHEFVNFQIVRYLPNLSTFIAIGLSPNHLWIFKLWFLRHIFPHSSHF